MQRASCESQAAVFCSGQNILVGQQLLKRDGGIELRADLADISV